MTSHANLYSKGTCKESTNNNYVLKKAIFNFMKNKMHNLKNKVSIFFVVAGV